MITEKDKQYLLSLKHEEITKDLIEEKFTQHYNPETKKIEPPLYKYQDEFILKKGEYYNKEDVKTNVGQLLVNKILYGNCIALQKAIGYIAQPYTKKLLVKTERTLGEALMEDEVTTEDFRKYFDNLQWVGNTFNTHVSCSFTPNTYKVLPSVEKKKKELYGKHRKEIEEGDLVTAVNIRNELLDMAKKELKDDIGMSLYDSGCKPAFGNNYGSMFVSRGPVYNAAEGKFENIETCFVEGMDKKDIHLHGTSVINGSYPKAIGTTRAGYVTKKFFACYQGVQLDKKGSDCGSKFYREVVLTDDNFKEFLYRYIMDGNKLVLLNPKVMPQYIGKKVKMRSPLYCCNEKICNVCAGDMSYRIGIENIGLTCSSIGSGFLNLLMKSFHSTEVSVTTVDIDSLIIE